MGLHFPSEINTVLLAAAIMSDVQQYLLKVDSDRAGAEKIAKDTAQSKTHIQKLMTRARLKADEMVELDLKETTLIDVVQSLGEYINDEDASIRSKAVTYLSHVISAVPDSTLSRQQVLVLCQFLCDRIEDGGAIGGLRELQSLSRFSREMAIMTFRA